MARVQVAAQAWGYVVGRDGRPRSGQLMVFSGTVYQQAAGGLALDPALFQSNDEGLLPGFVEPGAYTLTDPDGDSIQVDAFSGLDSALLGTTIADIATLRARLWVNVKDLGAVGDGATDDTTEIQAAIDAVQAAGGGTVFFPAGDYLVNGGLVVVENKPVRLVGSGMGMGFGAADGRPTRLIRSAGTTTMLSGVGSAFANRVFLEVCDIDFDGGSTAGDGIDIQRGQDVFIHRVRVKNCGGNGMRFAQLYNSSLSDVYFEACGNGATDPVLLFDGLNEGQGGCDTVHITNLEFGGNGGVEMKFTGHSGAGAGTDSGKFAISNVKIEGGGGSYPFIHLDHCGNIMFSNVHIGVWAARTGTPIVQDHPTGTGRQQKFVNLTVDFTGDGGAPYAIDNVLGGLQIDNLTIVGNGATPTAAGIHLAGSVTTGASPVQIGNVNASLPATSPLYDDDRTGVIPVTASAAALVLPPTGDKHELHSVSGVADITSITPMWPRRRVTILFSGNAAANGVVDGGTLKIAGNFVYTVNDTLQLVSDGTDWFEEGRNVN